MPIRVLHVIPAFAPAFEWGGPVFSTLDICRSLAASDEFELEVLTTDAANPNDRRPLALAERTVTFPEGFRVTYLPRRFFASGAPSLFWMLPRYLRKIDIVHLSFTYSFPTLPTLIATRLWNKPLIWSPHGALQATEEWEEVPHKRIKFIFEWVCALIMPRSCVLHVTAEVERLASLKRISSLRAYVIPNAVDIPVELPERSWRPEGSLRLVFLGRLHPKKGLDMALQVLARLPSSVTLDIYGNGAPDYERSLRAQIIAGGLEDRVQMHGHVEGANKELAMATADVFVLATRSENFGIAVAEALARGVPVITTTAAPWEGLLRHECGFWISPTINALQATMEHVIKLSGETLEGMGARGRLWMQAEFSRERVGAEMLQLYRHVVAGVKQNG